MFCRIHRMIEVFRGENERDVSTSFFVRLYNHSHPDQLNEDYFVGRRCERTDGEKDAKRAKEK